MRKKAKPMPNFEFNYREVKVLFSPEDLNLLMNFNVVIYVNGEIVQMDREESMRFMREYFKWLDEN